MEQRAKSRNRETGITKTERYSDKVRRERKRKLKMRERIDKMTISLMVAVCMCLAIGVVTSSLSKMNISRDIGQMQSEQEKLEQTLEDLIAKTDSNLDMASIEQYAANELGLVRLDRSQEEYIVVEKPDYVEVAEPTNGVDRLATSFVKSFSAFISMLR